MQDNNQINANTTLVSVVVPVYNMAKYLPECLGSIAGQTLRDIEIICVDDGSTDNSLEILRSFADKDKRIVAVSQDNLGSGPARNKAIDIAKGEYVCFMDPDDWYPSADTLEKLHSAATRECALVCGGSFSVYVDGVVTTNFTGKDAGYKFSRAGRIEYSEYQFDCGFTRFIYKRALLNASGARFPALRRFQDPPFFVSAMHAAGWFYAIPDVTYTYRRGHKSVRWMGTRKNKDYAKMLDNIEGLRMNLEFSRSHGLWKLHSLTTQRLEEDWGRSISNCGKSSIEVYSALVRLNSFVDFDKLDEFSGCHARPHVIRPLVDIWNGPRYKFHVFLGALSWPFRMIRRLVHSLRTESLGTTLRRVVSAIRNP